MPPQRSRHKDRYLPYRRPNLTPSERPSPFTFVNTLYEKLRSQVRKSAQEKIADDVQEFLNIISPSELVRSTGDDVSCIDPSQGAANRDSPPMHWHPRAVIRSGADLSYLRHAAREASLPREVRTAAEQVLSYWTSANSLKQLHRFVDNRQPILREVPLPDGSNIPDNIERDSRGSLASEWFFRRIFIRCLHLPGLWFSGDVPHERFKAFGRLYGIARCLLELELDRCPEKSIHILADSYSMDLSSAYAEPFIWFEESRGIITDILDDVADVAYEEHKSLKSRFFPNKPEPELSRNEMLKRNMTPQYMPRMLDAMIKRYEELMEKHPFERLIMDLITKEDTFERLMSQEHIEDKLIHKQIVPFDELDMTGGPDYSAIDIEDSYLEDEARLATGALLEDFIYKISPGISLVNRQRRNFRLVREWIKERSWLRLFHVYDPSLPGNAWQAEAIQTYTEYHNLRAHPKMDPLVPSHPRNVLGNLFGIEPWNVEEPHTYGGIDMFFCTLCQVETSGGDDFTNMMVILECDDDHVFHFGCLLEYWDQEGKYTHDCPECGMTPSLSHIRLGMYPDNDDPFFNTSHPSFVSNPYGWVPHAPEPGDMPDLQDYDVPPSYQRNHRYWQQENLLVATVANAPVTWSARKMTPNLAAEEESGVAPFDYLVRDLGHRWRMHNLEQATSEDYVMEDAFESARFAPSEEAAWLRMIRRRRNRIRRSNIEDAGEGMSRFMQKD